MAVKRMDNVGIVVDDLDATIAFFRELGLELEGQTTIEGDAMNSQISPPCSALPGANTQNHWARCQAAHESGSQHQTIPSCSAIAQTG